MNAKSISGQSPDDIQTALSDCMANFFNPTLAIVFISVKQDRTAVCELLTTHGIDVFGATSCGEFIDGHESDGGIVVLLLDIKREYYTLLFEDIGSGSVRETAAGLARTARQTFANPSLILCSSGWNPDGTFFDGAALVETVEQELGPDRLFFGGMAGDDMALDRTFLFTREQETSNGIIALVFDSDMVTLTGMAINGWQPMGISRKVTRCEGNLLFTIDDKPAVDMYLKYLGKGDKKQDTEFNILDELSFHYPFITIRDESGETLVKSPMSVDHEKNALVMDMEMKEGDEFWFSKPPDFDIADEITNEALTVKNVIGSAADALLIFSCAGRRPVLGPLTSRENDGLAEVWNSPMAGFFTYGEYGRVKNGRQHFHSSSCIWVALKEK